MNQPTTINDLPPLHADAVRILPLGGLGEIGLNLDGDMIGKFVPVILSFVQARGGDAVKGILEKVLK